MDENLLADEREREMSYITCWKVIKSTVCEEFSKDFYQSFTSHLSVAVVSLKLCFQGKTRGHLRSFNEGVKLLHY